MLTCRAGKHAVHLIVSRTATGSSVRFVAAFAAMHLCWAARCAEGASSLTPPRFAAAREAPAPDVTASVGPDPHLPGS